MGIPCCFKTDNLQFWTEGKDRGGVAGGSGGGRHSLTALSSPTFLSASAYHWLIAGPVLWWYRTAAQPPSASPHD